MLCTKNNGLNSSNYIKRIITLVLFWNKGEHLVPCKIVHKNNTTAKLPTTRFNALTLIAQLLVIIN